MAWEIARAPRERAADVDRSSNAGRLRGGLRVELIHSNATRVARARWAGCTRPERLGVRGGCVEWRVGGPGSISRRLG